MDIKFNTIEELLEDLKAGKNIVMIDDEDRENEGDVICAARFATQENINFMAKNTKADAIVCYTNSGDTARKFSGMGAGCPILAVTDNRRTFNQLALSWNVTPIFVEKQENIDKTIKEGRKKLQDKQILEKGIIDVNEKNEYGILFLKN